MPSLLTVGFSNLIAGPIIPSSETKAQLPSYSLKKSYWIIIKNSTVVAVRSHSVPTVVYAA